MNLNQEEEEEVQGFMDVDDDDIDDDNDDDDSEIEGDDSEIEGDSFEFDDRFRVKFSIEECYDEFDWSDPNCFALGSVPKDLDTISISGRIDPCDEKYKRLLDVLQNDNREWEIIYLTGPEEQTNPFTSTPAFLALLLSIIGKTKIIHLADCMTDDAAYMCLNGGLMIDGAIKGLQVTSETMARSKAEIFSHVLACTTSLEGLDMPNDMAADGVCTALAN